MKYTKKIFSTLAILLAVLFPTTLLAAELGIQSDKVILSTPENLVPIGEEVTIVVSVEETDAEAGEADLVFFVNEEEQERQTVSVESEGITESIFTWDAPETVGDVDIRFALENVTPTDSLLENNLVNLLGVEVLEADVIAERLEALRMEEEEAEETEEALALEDDIVLPPVLIHAEKLTWNTFRFRPAQMIASDEQDYIWSFGDETNSTSRVNEHTYSKPGAFQVQLEVFSGSGERQLTSIQVSVGFFNLANWRLWALIGLLAAIIIVGAIIASQPEKPRQSKKKKGPSRVEEALKPTASVPMSMPIAKQELPTPQVSDLLDMPAEEDEEEEEDEPEEPKKKKKKKHFSLFSKHGQDNEDEAHGDNDASGGLDTLASSGVTQDQLEQELAFLEEIDTGSSIEKPEVAESVQTEVATPVIEEAKDVPVTVVSKTKKRVKKTQKKRAVKKKTATKKKPKKTAAKKKSTPKKKKTSKSKN